MTTVVAVKEIHQQIGSVSVVHRPGSVLELDDVEAQTAIAARLVRPVPTKPSTPTHTMAVVR